MASLADRIRFAQQYLTTPDGQPFSFEGREWQIGEVWRPLSGFKFWPVALEQLCEDCRAKVNTITDGFYDADATRRPKHLEDHACKGLTCEPIIMVVLCLKRQSGKTTGTAGYALSTIFKEANEDIGFISSSEDQSANLFANHYKTPIESNAKLRERADVVGSSIYVRNKRSSFEYLSTSHSRVTGGSRTKVVIDEARDVPARVAMALIPSIFARGGWQCPHGHVRTETGVDAPAAPKKCSACAAKLEPWFGRILIMSSAAILDGDEDDWFAELVQHLRENPDPNVHLYEAEGVVNPKVSTKTVTMVSRVFGQLQSTRTYADVEAGNKFRRKGEDFVSELEYNAVIDPRLRNAEHGERPCVAFLDTSKTRELTSLVIAEDAPAPEEVDGALVWAFLRVCRIDIWEPSKQAARVIDERVIFDHLERYVPLFPLRALRVDTRLMPWATRLVARCKRESWGRLVEGVTWRDAERDAAWTLFESRILEQTLALPNHPQLKREVLGARRVEKQDNRVQIREPNRRKNHLDVAEGVAMCCYMAHLEALRPRGMGLAEMRKKSSAADILKRTRRPLTRGFGPNGY